MPQNEVWLNADPVRLEQIFVNLLNNAAKYTDPNGVITVSCTQKGSFIKVVIIDSGIGIAPDKIAGVFEPFGQIGAVVRRPGGLGVGLSLTKRLVEFHSGTINAKSRGLGFGSEFTVLLPLLPFAVGQTPAPKKRTIAESLHLKKGTLSPDGKRILVVDDNQPAAHGLGKLLERAGHTIAFAYNGVETIEMVQKFNPSVVVLDIGLPDMDGYEVCKQIRSTIKTPIRLIALTGYGQAEDRVKTKAAGFNFHFVKPVSISEIEKALK